MPEKKDGEGSGIFDNGTALVLGVAAALVGAEVLHQQGVLPDSIPGFGSKKGGGNKRSSPKAAAKGSSKKKGSTKKKKGGSRRGQSAYQTFVAGRMAHYKAKGFSPKEAMSKAAADWQKQKG